MTPLPLHNDLYQELLTELEQLDQEPDLVKRAMAGAGICLRIVEKLRARLLDSPFVDKAQEIQFFKEVKPYFLCWLIFYSELFELFARRRAAGRNPYKKGIKRLMRRMKKFYRCHSPFYTYCRVGQNHLDDHYFLRSHFDWKLQNKSDGSLHDTSFCTNNDEILARMLAYDELEKFILNWQNAQPAKGRVSTRSKFTWTAAKTYIKEAALGIHLAGFLNHGKTNITEVAMDLAEHYNISIEDMKQIIQQLKRLTKTNTPCLDEMRACILNRIEQSEELEGHRN